MTTGRTLLELVRACDAGARGKRGLSRVRAVSHVSTISWQHGSKTGRDMGAVSQLGGGLTGPGAAGTGAAILVVRPRHEQPSQCQGASRCGGNVKGVQVSAVGRLVGADGAGLPEQP